MRAKLASLNHCAVPFLSRAAANFCWYYYTMQYNSLYIVPYTIHSLQYSVIVTQIGKHLRKISLST